MIEMVGCMNNMGNLLPFLGMVIDVLAQTSNMVVSKVAMSDGVNKYVMVVYSFALSTLMLLPFAFLFNRSERPPLTFSALWSFFLLASCGSLAMILSYSGIDSSSPTLATAMLNLIPAFTFVLALIFRMEELQWRHSGSQAKVLGTIVSIAGAFVVIFYKGPPIFNSHTSISYNNLLFSPQLNWIIGGLYCAGDSLLSSLWYIYQVPVLKKYPDVTVVVFFQFFFCTVLSAAFALIAVTDQRAWILKLDIGLIAILYQAIVATGLRYILGAWCVQKAGPVFCAMFKPIGIIATVVMGAIFLGDDFYLGSLVGAVIIVIGFYGVMWGKATQEKKVKQGIENLESCCHNIPLLQNKT